MKSNLAAVMIFAVATIGGVVIFWLGRGTALATWSLVACTGTISLGLVAAVNVASNLDPDDDRKAEEKS